MKCFINVGTQFTVRQLEGSNQMYQVSLTVREETCVGVIGTWEREVVWMDLFGRNQFSLRGGRDGPGLESSLDVLFVCLYDCPSEI